MNMGPVVENYKPVCLLNQCF